MFLKVVLILSLCTEICRCHINLPMIKDFVEYCNNTKIILGFVCHKKDALQLLTHFSPKYQINTLPVDGPEIIFPLPPSYVVFILNANCPNVKQMLIQANKAKLFANPFKWVIYYDGVYDVNKLNEEYFKDLDIMVDSDVTLLLQNSVMKIYKRHVNTFLLVENIGNWTRDQGFIDNGYEKITFKRRRNLEKTVLNTALVITNNDSLNHLSDRRDIHIDSIAKASYPLVGHLAETVNATLKYSIEKSWGYKDNNSKWSGMIGQLTRKEADIGGTGLFFSVERVDFIHYLGKSTPTASNFLFRAPKLSYVSNVFTLPFHQRVWFSTCALFILTAVIFYVVTKWEWKKKNYAETSVESPEPEIRDSWSEIIFETFAAFCQQGTATVPYSIPGRVTLMFLLTSFMFLYTSYSANIVALLQSSSNSIKTIRDLLNSRFDIGVHDTVFNHFYFPNAKEPSRRALYLQKVAPPGQKPRYFTIEEGIKRVRNGLFAFHVETGPGYKLISETFQEDEKCGLQGIEFLELKDCWLAIQKNSSYTKMLKVGLLQLQENGIQKRQVGLIYPKKPPCLVGGSSFVSVGLTDCYGAAVVFVGGTGLAILILILEIYVNHRLKLYYRRNKRPLK